VRNTVGVRYSAPVQVGTGVHPVSCTMSTGFFPGVRRPERGVDQTQPHPVLRLKKGYELSPSTPPPPTCLHGMLWGKFYLLQFYALCSRINTLPNHCYGTVKPDKKRHIYKKKSHHYVRPNCNVTRGNNMIIRNSFPRGSSKVHKEESVHALRSRENN